MATIGFFGDSFCAGREPESWCVLLANKLNANIVHWGEPGRSIWSTFFNFNKMVRYNRIPDYSIFCYTEPYRMYHPNIVLSANTQRLDEVNPKIYDALDDYWKYLHSYKKDELAYTYSLKYFDREILRAIDEETQVVQMWSFKPFENAGREASIELTTGKFIDESMYQFSLSAGVKDGWGVGTINHMTEEQNKLWAEKVYERLTIQKTNIR